MNKANPLIRERNEQIRSLYWHYLQEGMPCMQAYAQVGTLYELSEDRIREIVAHVKC